MASFFWHDYETWGADPRRDRPCQFAGIRTDPDLNEIGEPVMAYCRPAGDLLPQPDACLVNGVTPSHALREGLIEARFAELILSCLGAPGTCGVGYNSLRFDDEVTRNLFYRNLLDPYAREWQNGNSRWDLIDTVRLAHALRPDGIEWPLREDGTPSFKLEHLTAANGIEHTGAHDALADVRATIALARLLRSAQPRLFDYALSLREKRKVRELLAKGEPLLHASARYPASSGCLAPVLPVANHPSDTNGVICFDLRYDPALLLDLDVEEIRHRLFTPASQLAPGVERMPLKTVHVNRSPLLAPMATLTPEAAARWCIDPAAVAERAARALAVADEIRERVQAVHQAPRRPAETDPDLAIYSGGFFSDADRRTLERVRVLSPEELAREVCRFQDPRLPEMLFRYRARNWPETLSAAERETWNAARRARLTDPSGCASIAIEAYRQRLAELASDCAGDPAKMRILGELAHWADTLLNADV